MCVHFSLVSEFCGHQNTDLDVDPDEVPKTCTADYLLMSSAENTQQKTQGDLLVYCIDVSASMDTSFHVPDLQGRLPYITFFFYYIITASLNLQGYAKSEVVKVKPLIDSQAVGCTFLYFCTCLSSEDIS